MSINEDSISSISEISYLIKEEPRQQTIDKDQINATLETIEKNLASLDNIIKESDTKVDELNRLVANLMKNKSINLDDTCKILNFQIEILNNEKTYVNNLKSIFLTRFQKDMYDVGEKVMIIATSINTIQFEEEELNRNKAQKKVIPVKKSLEATKSIYANIDSIYNNLNIIKDTVAYLDTCLEYVNQNVTDHITTESIANTHSNSLKLKRDYINVEFKQHYEAFKSRINYLSELLASLIKKMKV